MKRIHCLLFFGYLLLLTPIFYGAKVVEMSQEIETFVWNGSEQRELGIPFLTIVQPDPIPDPKPRPNPPENPRPTPL